jgi:hypothetical protein
MPRCRGCSLIIDEATAACPRCGAPAPSRSRVSARGIFAIAALVAVSAFWLWMGGRGHTAQTAQLPAAVPRPFVVAIETSISGGSRPTVHGTTNLPDGTELYAQLIKPWLPDGKERLAAGFTACGDDDCSPLQTRSKLPDGVGLGVVVKSGHFIDGPFTNNGMPLRPGEYVLEVSVYPAALQSAQVRAIVGQLGEEMTGSLVGACCFGSERERTQTHRDRAQVQKVLSDLRNSAPTMGASAYYARYVTIND